MIGRAVLAWTLALTGLFGAVGAAAQEILWEATMTVGLRDTNTSTPRNSGWYVGYEHPDVVSTGIGAGSISRDRFTVDGAVVVPTSLKYLTGSTDTDGTGASVKLQFEALLSSTPFPDDKADWVLTVGSDSFRLGDCSGHTTNVVDCTTTALDWDEDDEVAVKLTRPSPPQRNTTSMSMTTSGLLWGGTLTPKEFQAGGTNTGYQESYDGTLSPDTFVYGDDTYGVHGVFRDHNSGELVLELKDLPASCCVEGLGNADAHWTLYVDGYLYEFSEAGKEIVELVPGVSFHTGAYDWPNAPDLTVDEAVRVEITTTEGDLFPQLWVSDATVMESNDAMNPETTMMFTVNVNPAPAFPVGVHYKTEAISGQATAGASCTATPIPDYISTEGRLEFGRDETGKTVEVTVCNDDPDDSGETFNLVLNSTQLHETFEEVQARGTIHDYSGEPPTASGTGTITNDESTTPELSIAADADYVAEGAAAAFTLRRTGDAEEALAVPVTLTETGAALGAEVPVEATFAAGSQTAELRVPTDDDESVEANSTVTVTLGAGDAWQLAEDASSASLTVLDNDAAPATSTSTTDVTVWSADMTVVDYENSNIGAGSADLLANQGGTAGLLAKWLYYVTGERKLKIAFDDGLDDAGSMTLHVGGTSVRFPEDSGGDSSFNIPNVDVSWADGETLAARITKPSAAAVSTDATLASLAVSGAELSPAFDAGVLVYRANVGADTEAVTLSATTADDGATVSYGPAEDADGALADHQVATPPGETLVAVTVTAADGQTVRTYRVVVGRPVPVVVSFGSSAYTATEGGEAASVTVELDTDPKREVTIPLTATPEGGAAADDYTVADSVTFTGGGALLRTVVVTAVADDTAEENERVVLGFGSLPDGVEAGAPASATVTLADAAEAVNAPPVGLPSISGTAEVGQTLTASVSGISDADGMDDASFAYQWIGNDGADADIGGATGSSYTLQPSDAGKTIKVRVTFEDDGGTEETLVSEPTGAVNTPPTGAPTIGGTPRVGETLTADVTTIADADGMDDASFAYQWIGNDGADADIGGATGSSYALQPSDAGRTIKVRVTFEDDGGTRETLLSAATGTVAAALGVLSVADAEATEEEDATLDFAVTLDPAADAAVTVDYATTDGTATSGADYTGKSGTLTFLAGETAKTVSVSITDDAVDDGGETLTLTLANAAGAGIGAAAATGIIRDGDGNRLTASFEAVPAEHDGTTFVFHVRFSEDPAVSYRVLRDESFDVTGGAVVKARRKDGRNDLREIHVEPSGNGDVTVSLPPTTDCDADGAICTADGRPLSNANSATVAGATTANAVVDGPTLTLSWPTPPDGFAPPGGSDFAVRVDGVPRAVASASLWTAGVALHLSEPVQADQSVVLDYIGSAMHPLRDDSGMPRAPWQDLVATNVTGHGEPQGWAVAAEVGTMEAGSPPAFDGALSLSLAGGAVDDAGLWALAGRTELRRLDLSGNALVDVSALSGLAALESLDLSGNEVSDLTPLAGLTELRRLDLAGNRIGELWPLGELPNLEVLLLDGNRVADIGALMHLGGLENLGLSGNRVEDVAPLADLWSLRRLDLGGNPVLDLSPVGDLETLVWLRPSSAGAEVPTHRLVRLRWLQLAPNAGGVCLGVRRYGAATPGRAVVFHVKHSRAVRDVRMSGCIRHGW